jgi:uncharacterized repeat protein (TIGR03803 family)
MSHRSLLRSFIPRHVPRIVFAATLAFAIAPSGASAYTLTTLHSFCAWANCGDGIVPSELLEDSSGDLYGTAEAGGKYGEGVVFKLLPNPKTGKYNEHVLHNFCKKTKCPDGKAPVGGLIMDIAGNLYGVTEQRGKSNAGVIFEMTPVQGGWSYKVLHSFCNEANCTDGALPTQGLSYLGQESGALWDGKVPIFGTTSEGGVGTGYGNGIDYEITSAPISLYMVIHTFTSGIAPQRVLVTASGSLFGTTVAGGKYNHGLLYRLTPSGGTWTDAVLHNFCANAQCTDGADPFGRLAMDAAGNLFGATRSGGANCNVDCGVTFERPAGGGYQVTYSFCSLSACGDGGEPLTSPVIDSSGNLFGTTARGGPNGGGIVYKLTPGGTLSVLYGFCAGGPCVDGDGPIEPLLLNAHGDLFGSTFGGGANGDFGTVFELTP